MVDNGGQCAAIPVHPHTRGDNPYARGSIIITNSRSSSTPSANSWRLRKPTGGESASAGT